MSGGDVDVAAQRRRADRTALALAPGAFLVGVAGGIAFPILPIVGRHAGLPLWLIGAILAANRAGRVLTAPIVGTLSDRLGGRRLLLGGLVIQLAVLGFFLLGVTTGRPGLFFLVGRALHGPGSAAVFVSGQALALHAGGQRFGGRAAAQVRGAITVGLPAGLVVGGVMSERFGNAATFESAMVAIVAAGGLAFWLVPDIRAPPAARAPIRVVLRSLSDRRLAAVGLLNASSSFAAQGLMLTTLALVVAARALSFGSLGSNITASVLMGGFVVVTALTMLAASRLATRRRHHARLAAAGVVSLTAGLVIVAWAPGLAGMCAGLFALAAGAGAIGSALLALLGELVDAQHRGAAVGLFQLCGDVGGSLGPLIGATLLAAGTATPYLAGAGVSVAALPVALWLVRRVDDAPGAGAQLDGSTSASSSAGSGAS